MKHIRRLYTTIVIGFLAGGCPAFFCSTAPAHAESPAYRPDDVIARVHETYDRVYSASGLITRIIEVDDKEPDILNGRFAIKKPDHMLVEFMGKLRYFNGYDGITFRVYFPEENRGYYQETNRMKSLEKFVLGPGPYFGNMLKLADSGFTFEITDHYQGNLVLKATPGNPLKIAYILFGIDPKSWTIGVVEYFDKNNELVSQTRFNSFRTFGNNLFIPTSVTTTTLEGGGLVVEKTLLTRVELNIPIEEEVFRIPSDNRTEWIASSVREKP